MADRALMATCMLFQIRSLNDSGAKGDDMASLAGGAEVKGKPSTQVRAYTFFMTAFSAALLVRLMAHPALAFEDPKEVARFGGPAQVAVLALALMSLGGALGGCLYSLRRLSLHSAAGDYSAGHDFSYYARPLSSGISGLMVCQQLRCVLGIAQQLGGQVLWPIGWR